MARINKNFQLGFTRQQLIEAAQIYGKSEKSAKKASTKTLENYLIKQVAGKKAKIPYLTPTDKREVQLNTEAWGVKEGLKRLTYRVEKIAGMRDDENFLRLTIRDGFSLFYTGRIEHQHVDELISRLPRLYETQVDSDMINISPFYQNLFIEYAEELEDQEKEREAV